MGGFQHPFLAMAHHPHIQGRGQQGNMGRRDTLQIDGAKDRLARDFGRDPDRRAQHPAQILRDLFQRIALIGQAAMAPSIHRLRIGGGNFDGTVVRFGLLSGVEGIDWPSGR
jgi:hypothetical protein